MTSAPPPNWQNKSQSWQIFSRIFTKYDQLNKILSLGLDSFWRKKMIQELQKFHLNVRCCLDLATGTGDVAFALLEQLKQIPQKVIGLDLCEQMLSVAKQKAKKKKLEVQFIWGDAEKIPFIANKFDCITMAFGIRNVENPNKCLQEIYRVLTPDGTVAILEFSLPQNAFIKTFVLLYLRYILPMIGWMFSGDKSAYVYLNKTIESFPHGLEFVSIMEQEGFVKIFHRPMSLGIVTLYLGKKN